MDPKPAHLILGKADIILETVRVNLGMDYLNGKSVHMDLGDNDMNLRTIQMNQFINDLILFSVQMTPAFNDPYRESGDRDGGEVESVPVRIHGSVLRHLMRNSDDYIIRCSLEGA